MVSVTDPYVRILGFLDRSRYFFFQVTPQLYSQGWVDPVLDPLLLRKSGTVGNQTRTSGSVARTLTTRPQTDRFEYFSILCWGILRIAFSCWPHHHSQHSLLYCDIVTGQQPHLGVNSLVQKAIGYQSGQERNQMENILSQMNPAYMRALFTNNCISGPFLVGFLVNIFSAFLISPMRACSTRLPRFDLPNHIRWREQSVKLITMQHAMLCLMQCSTFYSWCNLLSSDFTPNTLNICSCFKVTDQFHSIQIL
jgi:hypothetical protein